ncbi:MAG: hypothetical protein FWE76_08320, partial [Symbiobacteriaceae bacterium]|nr:hypothetical protein [Symbiobacteriaceae bacterium]
MTVVNDHDITISRAFAYLGYDHEVIPVVEGNYDLLRQRIVASIDAGIPVLAFGIIGPPECSIICGYEDAGTTMLGWSHFQSRDPANLASNGMFTTSKWYDGLWKIVICGKPSGAQRDLKEIIQHGLTIATATSLGKNDNTGEEGLYAAGLAAYDAWIAYVSQESYSEMPSDELRRHYWFHSTMVGNNAEAKSYLGGYLHHKAGEDADLNRIADYYDEIHSISWQIWEAAGGSGNKEAYLAFSDPAKRKEIADLVEQMKTLEMQAIAGF